jgi:hypothetical protein
MGMAHQDHLIDLVDSTGSVIGQKLRKEVDKTNDLYHGIYVLFVTTGKDIVLSKIPQRDDLPNVYAGKFGLTVATIRRHAESRDEAAHRALMNEAYIRQPRLTYLGDIFAPLPDGRKPYISAYYTISDVPTGYYSQRDIDCFEVMTVKQFEAEMLNNPDLFAPTLPVVWGKYKQSLFVGVDSVV